AAPEGQRPVRPCPGRQAADLRHRRGAGQGRRVGGRGHRPQGTREELRLPDARPPDRPEQGVPDQVSAAPPLEDLLMQLNRRPFLRAAGVALALPWLAAFAPSRALAAASGPRRRMVCICTPLGLHPPYFFPQTAGKDYPLTPYLDVLKDLRDDFTVLSGLSHP